jgi:hypothetical protein
MLTKKKIASIRYSMENCASTCMDVVTNGSALLDMSEMYLVALWAMQMPCESCPMAHPCMTLAASVGETACRRGFEARADEWRELWRARE